MFVLMYVSMYWEKVKSGDCFSVVLSDLAFK